MDYWIEVLTVLIVILNTVINCLQNKKVDIIADEVTETVETLKTNVLETTGNDGK